MSTFVGFPDMSSYLPEHLEGAAQLADGWVTFDGEVIAMGGCVLDALTPPQGALDAAGMAEYLLGITHPDDLDLFDARWFADDQTYDQVVRLGTPFGFRPFMFRTIIEDGRAAGLIFQVPLHRLIDEPLRRRMVLESALTRAIESLLTDDRPDIWSIGSELFPKLAAMLGARRAHFGEVTADGIRPVANYIAPGVQPGLHRREAAEIMSRVALEISGTYELDPYTAEPEFIDLADVMQRRGVESLLLITPDTGRDEAVIMVFELPAVGAARRDTALVQGVVNILNGVLRRDQYARAVQRATALLGALAEMSNAEPQPPMGERIGAALSALRAGLEADAAMFRNDAVDPVEAHRSGECPSGWQVDERIRQEIATMTDGPLTWRLGNGTLMAARVPMDETHNWGVLVVNGLPSRSAVVAGLEAQVTTAVASWLGVQLTRERMLQRLRGRERDLAALSSRRDHILEDERVRIARELHDELGQVLTASVIELGLLRDRILTGDGLECPDRIADQLRRLMDAHGQAIGTVRAICADLRPPLLDEAGLVAALEWEVERCNQRAGVHVDLTVDGAEPLVSARLRADLYRIAQEALTNVVRHSHATHAWVHLTSTADAVHLTISDDGVGIRQRGDDEPRLGILGMRERASGHGGVLAVSPRSGGGTTVTATVPLEGA